MAIKVTPHLIDLAYEAALKSIWRKKALRKFLRECYISEKFLATWDTEESKREFLDRVFENLQKSNRGKSIIVKIALFLADQTTFPDLRNWENSGQKISEAAKAVKDLKFYLDRHNAHIKTEKEKEAAKEKARKERAKIQRNQTDLKKLQERLDNLHSSIGTQQAGYDFQDWFYDLLDFCEISNRRPYKSNGRQIDGSLTHEGTTYLVELKFTASQVDVTDIDSLYKKVTSKADNTMGIMVSISGYSTIAIDEASGEKTPLLLMDHSHLYYVLNGTMKMGDIIERLRRHASQTAESYLPVSKFGG